jgi:hypothetical protein
MQVNRHCFSGPLPVPGRHAAHDLAQMIDISLFTDTSAIP